jgi:DNA-binding response OmpR family regulator
VRILVADVPQMDERYTAALEGWKIAFVRTMGEARQALGAARHDLAAIGVYFDDSRMFDLIRALRADRAHRKMPIVCVRGRPGFTAVSSRTLALSLHELGVHEFIELLDSDDGVARAALRGTIERLVRA